MIFENVSAFTKRICCFSAFVDTAQCFPHPLSKEEEKEALIKNSQGDKKARDSIITHNLRLVAHIVKKFQNSLEADDLISVGTIGLIKAVDSFNIEKNIKFSTYASRCIENEILMLIRANKRHKDVVSLSSVVPGLDSDDNELDLEHSIPADNEDIIEGVEQRCEVDKIRKVVLRKLKPIEQRVIIERYGLNGGDIKSQREVAKQLDISRSYVSRIETKAIKTIKEEIPFQLEEQS